MLATTAKETIPKRVADNLRNLRNLRMKMPGTGIGPLYFMVGGSPFEDSDE